MVINICLASDNNYAKYLAVTIASILKNANYSDELHFYILDGGIDNLNKHKLQRLISKETNTLVFICASNEVFERFPKLYGHISLPAYYRFIIADLLLDIDKVIYLDCDIIVQTSLSELYKINIDDYCLAGVEDVGYMYWRNVDERLIHQFDYINTGVLLINLKTWRERNIGKQLINYVSSGFDKYLFDVDQGVINYVCKDRIKFIDYRWNVQDSFYRPDIEVSTNINKVEIINASDKPAIVHFTGTRKPWVDNLIISLPMAYLYYKYLKYTAWKIDYFIMMIFLLKKIVYYAFKSPKKVFNYIENLKNISM